MGSVRRSITAALAAVMLVPSFGTAWTARTPSVHSHIDPSLSAGEVALVQTSVGHAGALSLKLAELGAVEIETDSAVNMVIARLSPQALAAIATDPTVLTATPDTAIVATGDRPGDRPAFEDNTAPSTSTSAYATSLMAIRAPSAWTRSTGAGVTVAVVDTGIADHPDLGNRKVKARVDFVHALGSLATLAIVAFLTQTVLFFLLRGSGNATLRTASFLADLVIAPVIFLGFALLYVDQAARSVARARV